MPAMPGSGFKSVNNLAQRQFPWLAGKLILKSIPKRKGCRCFTLETRNNQLYISASSASAASRGLDWYVKHYAHQSVSHFGNNIRNINKLPIVSPLLKKDFFGSVSLCLELLYH